MTALVPNRDPLLLTGPVLRLRKDTTVELSGDWSLEVSSDKKGNPISVALTNMKKFSRYTIDLSINVSLTDTNKRLVERLKRYCSNGPAGPSTGHAVSTRRFSLPASNMTVPQFPNRVLVDAWDVEGDVADHVMQLESLLLNNSNTVFVIVYDSSTEDLDKEVMGPLKILRSFVPRTPGRSAKLSIVLVGTISTDERVISVDTRRADILEKARAIGMHDYIAHVAHVPILRMAEDNNRGGKNEKASTLSLYNSLATQIDSLVKFLSTPFEPKQTLVESAVLLRRHANEAAKLPPVCRFGDILHSYLSLSHSLVVPRGGSRPSVMASPEASTDVKLALTALNEWGLVKYDPLVTDLVVLVPDYLTYTATKEVYNSRKKDRKPVHHTVVISAFGELPGMLTADADEGLRKSMLTLLESTGLCFASLTAVETLFLLDNLDASISDVELDKEWPLALPTDQIELNRIFSLEGDLSGLTIAIDRLIRRAAGKLPVHKEALLTRREALFKVIDGATDVPVWALIRMPDSSTRLTVRVRTSRTDVAGRNVARRLLDQVVTIVTESLSVYKGLVYTETVECTVCERKPGAHKVTTKMKLAKTS